MVMSDFKALRKKAADFLNYRAKKNRSSQERDAHRRIAASYKVLAVNEAWLAGEKQRNERSKKPGL
jgi:hypothetical protein